MVSFFTKWKARREGQTAFFKGRTQLASVRTKPTLLSKQKKNFGLSGLSCLFSADIYAICLVVTHWCYDPPYIARYIAKIHAFPN